MAVFVAVEDDVANVEEAAVDVDEEVVVVMVVVVVLLVEVGFLGELLGLVLLLLLGKLQRLFVLGKNMGPLMGLPAGSGSPTG